MELSKKPLAKKFTEPKRKPNPVIEFTIFDTKTGEIIKTGCGTRDIALLQVQSGQDVYFGKYQDDEYRIDVADKNNPKPVKK